MFRFKGFSISDENSIMKIGTDSVLLAAWVEESAERILDIGTGSGLISLILAHKTNALIDAVEIDTMSAKQASENIRLCGMSDRIAVHNKSFSSFINSESGQYDLIVTNPPYFTSSLKSGDKQKNLWRHTDTLTQEALLYGVSRLLTAEGSFYVILPFSEYGSFADKALKESLYINKKLNIIPKQNKPANRILLRFSKHKTLLKQESSLTIRNSDNSFTQDYKSVTKDYYLDF